MASGWLFAIILYLFLYKGLTRSQKILQFSYAINRPVKSVKRRQKLL